MEEEFKLRERDLGQRPVGAGFDVRGGVLGRVVARRDEDEARQAARRGVERSNLADDVGARLGVVDGREILVREDDIDVRVAHGLCKVVDGLPRVARDDDGRAVRRDLADELREDFALQRRVVDECHRELRRIDGPRLADNAINGRRRLRSLRFATAASRAAAAGLDSGEREVRDDAGLGELELERAAERARRHDRHGEAVSRADGVGRGRVRSLALGAGDAIQLGLAHFQERGVLGARPVRQLDDDPDVRAPVGLDVHRERRRVRRAPVLERV
mmetsp:Transcript_24246/g.81770  ORF Transcript_24246/g.81770 Transcript_24246/m.81770 type:complete len:274 (-) Transcript_24246:1784-2605(-)